jgi:hypothetical protein
MNAGLWQSKTGMRHRAHPGQLLRSTGRTFALGYRSRSNAPAMSSSHAATIIQKA